MVNFFSSIATRLSFGAALIGLVAAASSGFVLYETNQLNARVRALLAAEERLEIYSALSTQITTLAVAALDDYATQNRRATTLEPVEDRIENTFALLKKSIGKDVEAAANLGLNEQSRRATRGITIARMEAIYRGIDPLGDTSGLQARLNIFSTTFQPLLGSAINEEQRTRNSAFEDIARIRKSLNFGALGAVGLVLALLIVYTVGLVRPMISRINLLRDATARIGQEDFSVSLPGHNRDEIGLLFEELNSSSSQLAKRKLDVEAEWQRLSDVIDERTEALRNANAALALTDENRRRFFADVSHEMRTPLTVIITEAEIGAAQSQINSDSFDIIQSRAKNLNRRVDDLLRLARSESGELKINTEVFELFDAAEIAVSDSARQASRARLIVTLKGDTSLRVLGDRNWTRQVISAVIENTIRHAESDTLTITITENNSMGYVHMSDNGNGIPTAQQAQIFERFEQGTAKSSNQGFGIGLHFARSVMQAQNGTLTLVSPDPETKHGTIFSLELPLGSNEKP